MGKLPLEGLIHGSLAKAKKKSLFLIFLSFFLPFLWLYLWILLYLLNVVLFFFEFC